LPAISHGSLVIVEGRAPVVGQWHCINFTDRRLPPSPVY
jgi:hypothetical protein